MPVWALFMLLATAETRPTYASGRGVAGAAVAGVTHGCVVPIIVDIVIGALPPPRW